VRIAVLVIRARASSSACFAQVRTDRAVGRVEFGVDDAALSAEPAQSVAIFAVAFDRELGIDAVRLAQVKVVLAMVGRHMDKAGAAVGGDEIAGQERAGLGKEAAQMVHRVAGDGSGEVGAFAGKAVSNAPT
jgi:hypothetical protein